MLLSDRDLAAEIKAGALALEPFEPALLQPWRTWPARAAGTAGAVTLRPGLVATMGLKCPEHPGCQIGYKAGPGGRQERVHLRPRAGGER